jgi:hypothetical protein
VPTRPRLKNRVEEFGYDRAAPYLKTPRHLGALGNAFGFLAQPRRQHAQFPFQIAIVHAPHPGGIGADLVGEGKAAQVEQVDILDEQAF